jgi:hypothetical protein
VQPEAREGLPGEGLRLRDLVFMMRKNQVYAAGVDIQRLAQILNGHHGALDVPSGPAAADGLVPENFAFFRRFPQGEIARVRFFVLVHVDARARANAAEIVVRQLAVFRKSRNAEVDGTVAGVSVAVRRQALDGLRHFVNVLGGGHHMLGRLQAKQRAIVAKGLFVVRGVLVERLVARHGVANDLVVHIGDVHDVVDPEAAGAQPSPQDVHEGKRAEVADVRVIVDGGAARVHAHGVVPLRGEFGGLLRERVVEAQRHGEGNFYRSRRHWRAVATDAQHVRDALLFPWLPCM